ncbi:MAG: hypothetical protein VYE73_17295 [Acidobacteriota bacterium]|nr:hypothetical protein [Acidobacteriota bacterium]
MKPRPHHYLLGAALSLLAVGATAQTTELNDLKSQMDALQKGQQAIQKDLVEIRKLLSQQRQPAKPSNQVPANTVLSLQGRPTKGAPGAQLVVIEFLDYQ